MGADLFFLVLFAEKFVNTEYYSYICTDLLFKSASAYNRWAAAASHPKTLNKNRKYEENFSTSPSGNNTSNSLGRGLPSQHPQR